LPLQVGHARVQVWQQASGIRGQGLYEGLPRRADWAVIFGWGDHGLNISRSRDFAPQFIPVPGWRALLRKRQPFEGFAFRDTVLQGRGVIHQTIVAGF
jgi:hypothetical protein